MYVTSPGIKKNLKRKETLQPYMLESILMTLNAEEQESGVYIAESGCILPLLWEGISTLRSSHFTELAVAIVYCKV